MAGLKEIRRRITSVKNTRQITRAMKLVSAAKLKRAQDTAVNGRNFSQRLFSALNEVLSELSDNAQLPFMAGSEHQVSVQNAPRRIIVVSGERGLCGAYNSNLIKAVVAGETHPQTQYVLMGRRGVSAGRRFGWNAVGEFEGLGEDATKWPIEQVAEQAIKDYLDGKISQVVVYYTQFVSAMTQRVNKMQLLPFEKPTSQQGLTRTEFAPDPLALASAIIPLCIRAMIREAAFESKASEHAARMTAMDSATRNAGDLIDKLRLFYNRARQASITKELLDIIGGAEAIK